MRREKYVPNGGPDGGDGGRGGHVILRGNRNYWTLLHLKYDRHVFATHGGNGSKNKSFGKDGEDKVIEVPCGTVVIMLKQVNISVISPNTDKKSILLKGGRGGLGNLALPYSNPSGATFCTTGRTHAGADGYFGN